MIDREVANTFDKSLRGAKAKTRLCMYPGCGQQAIQSHVFQKNGVLSLLAEKQHLITVDGVSTHKFDQESPLQFKRVGINDVYTFKGFCKRHDHELFRDIERPGVDWFQRRSQLLVSYRSLCQELRRKQIMVDFFSSLVVQLDNPQALRAFIASRDGHQLGARNLEYYKTLFESEIASGVECPYHFRTISFPQVLICINSPVSVTYGPDFTYQSYKNERGEWRTPFETNTVCIFPTPTESVSILGWDPAFENPWLKQLMLLLETGSQEQILKALSDLIAARIEFWCLAPKLYHQLQKANKEAYVRFFLENGLNHSSELAPTHNLFAGLNGS